MTARLLILPIAFAGLLLTVGCAGPDDPAQAPEPRPKVEKTKAELLVGKWKLVKRTPPYTGGTQMTFEYTRDGKVTLRKVDPLRGEEIETGTYRVEGNTLFRTMDTGSRDRNVTIESISEDKLVTFGSRTGEVQVHEYERIEG